MKISTQLSLLLLAASGLVSVAQAADLPTRKYDMVTPKTKSNFFVDLGVGAGFGNINSLHFINPIGTAFTSSPHTSTEIFLNNKSNSDSSFAGAASLGYFLTPQIYTKASYRYFGNYDFKGSARFGGSDYEQKLNTKAHGALIGLGYVYDITPKIFLDGSLEAGLAFLNNSATQGANLGVPSTFPSKSQTNFAGGAGLGLGYRLADNLDVVLAGNYHYLGKAETGVSAGTAFMNAGEQLKAKDLTAASATIGVRYKF